MIRIAVWAALLALIALFPASAFAASVYDSSYRWRAFETDHFEIVYHDGAEFIARKAAVVAESQYGALTKLFHWEPRRKIRLVISDDVDDTNGSSSMTPWNTMRIYAALPHAEDRLDHYDDWIRAIITHELTHAIHLDSARGVPLGLRYTFGRWLFLHHMQPIFQVEGLAVWTETELTTMGRNRSSVSDMMLRAAAMEDRFPSVDLASSWTRRWPSGGTPYIFGGMFHDYIARHNDPNTIGDYSYKHAGQIWPFMFNINAKGIWGKKVKHLWRDFESEAREKAQRQYGEIAARGITPLRELSSGGRQQRRPLWIDDRRIVVEEHSPTRHARLAEYDLDTGEDETLVETELTGGAAHPPGGGIVFAQHSKREPFTQYYDLFELANGDLRRITRESRLRDPAATPDGKSVYAVDQEMGRTRVVRVDVATGAITVLFGYDRFPFFTQFGPPAVSPDGETLVLSLWHDDGNRDLFAYDIASDRFKRLTAHPGRDIDPAFSADGRYLFFVSDRTGVHNVHALDFAREKLFQVTNVVTGVFEPAPSPDGRHLAMISYSSYGFDLAVTDLDPAAWREVAPDPIPEDAVLCGTISASVDRAANDLAPPEREYSPWSTLIPSYWKPLYSSEWVDGEMISNLGFTTSGIDSIFRHSWLTSFVYDLDHNFPNIYATYAYDGFRPTLQATFSRSGLDWGHVAEDPTGDTFTVFQDRIAGAIGASYRFTDELATFAHFTAAHSENHVGTVNVRNEIPNGGWLAGPRFGFSASTGKSYAMSISPEDGGFYVISGAVDHEAFGSDYNVLSGVVAATQYVSLPFRNNVLRFDLKAGAVQGDDRYRGGFRVGGTVESDLTAQTADNQFALRGFRRAALVGERAVVGSIDWRMPLWYQQRGLGVWPIFFDTLSASVFATAGKTWYDELDLKDPWPIYDSYGVELYQSLGIAYYSNWILSAAYAYSPEKRHPNTYYINTGTGFF
ncbi:MAG: PD40 domain-containing protein [Deltaproteobacteria bacterium]|nr:PD40 domain-containing protein [Deltaproteobacteria bacterium]